AAGGDPADGGGGHQQGNNCGFLEWNFHKVSFLNPGPCGAAGAWSVCARRHFVTGFICFAQFHFAVVSARGVRPDPSFDEGNFSALWLGIASWPVTASACTRSS